MKQLLSIAALAALVSSFALPAQAADKSGYLTDKSGNIITSKTTGLCVRTKEWTAENADAACMAKSKSSK
jgi:hypothetical protein